MSTPAISGLSKTGLRPVTVSADPRTTELWQQLRGGAGPGLNAGLGHLSQLAGGGNEQMWGQLEAPALRQFGQLQGQLASRFSGMGTGARRSSGFQNASSSAATDLSERLQGQRLGLQNQALEQLLGLSQNLLGTNLSDTFLTPKKKPWWQELIGSLAGGAGQAGGALGGSGLGKLFF